MVEYTGERGLIWKGVRMVNTPDHKDLRGRRIEVEYLTTGGSNVMAVVMRAVNLYSTPLNVSLGTIVDVPPGPADVRRTFADVMGVRQDQRPADLETSTEGRTFVGACNDAGGRSVILVPSKATPEATVRAMEGEALLLTTRDGGTCHTRVTCSRR